MIYEDGAWRQYSSHAKDLREAKEQRDAIEAYNKALEESVFESNLTQWQKLTTELGAYLVDKLDKISDSTS